ncbi:MAG TPA: hypothetical protein VGF92_02200 [Stellaceae bacterium]
MKFVCDSADGKTWFRIETTAEAMRESDLMGHAIEKYFAKERGKAAQSFTPASTLFIEQEIGLDAHLQREMPWFLTLRDGDGTPLASAMVQLRGREDRAFMPIIVGTKNSDPYPAHAEAIRALAKHLGITLDRARCYPYGRRIC